MLDQSLNGRLDYTQLNELLLHNSTIVELLIKVIRKLKLIKILDITSYKKTL